MQYLALTVMQCMSSAGTLTVAWTSMAELSLVAWQQQMVFIMSSLLAGVQHCTQHTAYGVDQVSLEQNQGVLGALPLGSQKGPLAPQGHKALKGLKGLGPAGPRGNLYNIYHKGLCPL